MNPLLFKAHPLLTRWIDLLTDPSGPALQKLSLLLSILLASNILWAIGLPGLLRKAGASPISPVKAYLLALPATWLYSPLMLTVMGDIMQHGFALKDRWFMMLAILIASQFLTVFYAVAIRNAHDQQPIGLESGLSVALFELLVAIPATLLMSGINTLFHII